MPENRKPTDVEDRALVEAALFLAPQPMTRHGLAKILGEVQAAYVDRLLADLRREYDAHTHGLELHIEEGRAGFRVKAMYIERVSHLAPQQDIPRPILRSLAVIAYNHPMMQSDLVRVRGNKAYTHVQELLARNLIRSEASGRSQLLYVTKEFLRHFGLGTVEEFRFHVAGLPELVSEPESDQAEQSEQDMEKSVEAQPDPGSESEPDDMSRMDDQPRFGTETSPKLEPATDSATEAPQSEGGA